MNRRNALMFSDDVRSETPGRSMTGGYADDGQAAYSYEPLRFSDDVRSETPGRAMTGGYTDDGQAAYAAAARKAIPLARQVTQAAAAAEPAKRGLFGGPQYQSTGQAVVERMQGPMRSGEERAKPVLNWGNQENAADFFRADQAMREMMKNKEEFEGRASGGKVGSSGAGGKEAAIHKALEIIHHLLTRR